VKKSELRTLASRVGVLVESDDATEVTKGETRSHLHGKPRCTVCLERLSFAILESLRDENGKGGFVCQVCHAKILEGYDKKD
jgi:CRISPR/Cas system-associated protein Cas10 (large subunit of type III CRISPR-Cas system)